MRRVYRAGQVSVDSILEVAGAPVFRERHTAQRFALRERESVGHFVLTRTRGFGDGELELALRQADGGADRFVR